MAAKVRALQEWCRQQCDGYRDVNITNMTSSWKSGLAFCAIIHRYRPDVIDYHSLSKENVFENNKLAFDVAEQLGIPALLDAEDMVMMAVPDKLCIVTYVAQYYNYFHNKPQGGGPAVRAAGKSKASGDAVITEWPSKVQPPEAKKPALSTSNQKVASLKKEADVSSKRSGTMDDRCHACRGRVYLLERHYTPAGNLYHRHCYRTAQRTSTLQRSTLKSDKENAPAAPSSGGGKGTSAATGVLSLSNERDRLHPTSIGSTSNSPLIPKGSPNISSRTPAVATVASSSVAAASSTGLIKALYSPRGYQPATTSTPASTQSVIKSTLTSVTTCSTTTKLTPTNVTTSTFTTSSSSRSSADVARFSFLQERGSPIASTAASTSASRYSSGLASRISPVPAPSGIAWPSVRPTSTTKSEVVVTLAVFTRPVTSSPAARGIFTTSAAKVPNGTGMSSTGSKPNVVIQDYSSPGFSGTKVSWTSGLSRPSSVAASSTVSSTSSGGYVSPFTASNLKLTPAASRHHDTSNVSSLSSSSGLRPFSAHFEISTGRTPAQDQRQPVSSCSSTVDKDQLIIASLLQKVSEARDRSQQSPRSFSPVQSRVPPATTRDASSADNKTEWQLEAERRQAARNGVYVDPEKQPRKSVPLPDRGSFNSSIPGNAPRSSQFSNKNPTVTYGMYMLRPTPRLEAAGRGSNVNSTTGSPQEYPNTRKRSDSSEPYMSVEEITRRLEELDSQLREVETEGRDLEERIRTDSDDAMDEDKDSLMVNWFALIKRRNEFIREESDLIYRRREQELEEQHQELEYQLRPLLEKPEDRKSYTEKRDEERLLQELVDIVEQRNNIVDSIEVDRLRYIQEDQQIEEMIAESGLSADKNGKSTKKGHRKKSPKFAEKDGKSLEKTKTKKKLFKFKSKSGAPRPDNTVDEADTIRSDG